MHLLQAFGTEYADTRRLRCRYSDIWKQCNDDYETQEGAFKTLQDERHRRRFIRTWDGYHEKRRRFDFDRSKTIFVRRFEAI